MTKKLMMMVAAVAAAFGAWAETETVGGYTWTYSINGYTWTYRINGDKAEISKSVYSAAISPSPSGAVTIPSTLGGNLKATTVNVAGIVVGGVGYGTATIKKVGSVPIEIQ